MTTDAAATPRILVLDDEEPIRRILDIMLRRQGCDPLCVATGPEAINAFTAARAEGRAFAAVILDLTLSGGQSGRTVLAGLHEIDPAVRAILASGYIRDSSGQAVPEGFCGILPKPFRPGDVARAIEQALGRPPPSDG